ncbi:hypothetical protein [Streptomyces sp. 2224.1]|uniref:hypothetical protein n=1 Tax=Streptomyces sp. 2224.1 TaxID=1881020 RepID=UPI000B85F007|nr:hypothetical protein [Streptomyces sp. 2224.1]
MGSKTVEVRQQRVAAPPGTTVVLYAPAPTQTGISRREFDEYTSGAAQAADSSGPRCAAGSGSSGIAAFGTQRDGESSPTALRERAYCRYLLLSV